MLRDGCESEGEGEGGRYSNYGSEAVTSIGSSTPRDVVVRAVELAMHGIVV